jgi:hypothetical protein
MDRRMPWEHAVRCGEDFMSTSAEWFKSTFSDSGNCVQVRLSGGASVRDSKDPSGPVLRFTEREWAAFLDGVRNGEFDLGRPPDHTDPAY